jgi:hypothetical protein
MIIGGAFSMLAGLGGIIHPHSFPGADSLSIK